MKNFLLLPLLLFSMLVVSCKQDEKKTDQTTAVEKKNIADKQNSKNVGFAAAPVPEPCDEKYCKLVINASKLKNLGIYDSWQQNEENKDMVCTTASFDRKGHSHEYFVVSLEKFKDILEQANWLQKNADYICYEESYQFIEKLRLITADDKITINSFQNASAFTKKFKDMKSDSALDLNDRYANFLTVTMEVDSPPTFGLTSKFGTDPICLSMPFLNSIFTNNNITDPDNCDFIFKCRDVTRFQITKKVIVFQVMHNGALLHTEYYDYSTQPGSASLRYNFL